VTAAHSFLPDGWRPVTFALLSSSTLVPIALLLWRCQRGSRLPWWLTLAAMATLTAANTVIAVGGPTHQLVTDLVVTAGHAVLLAAALALVMRRGRNDIGGLIDASVVLMGIGGLLWTSLLQPRLAAVHAQPGEQVALLVSVFVLAGVLGALGRLWVTAGQRLVALQLFVYALLLALVGNSALAVTTGSMTTHRLPWVETFFMVAYLCVGAAVLHPSAHELTRLGPAPPDRLSAGRLAFLAAAVVINPVLGGGREVLGLPADGLLIALGSLAVGPLVMVRIGHLAGQRERAERALRHQAFHDALTGLPNRTELLARLGAALTRERNTGRVTVALLFCDLNGFKAVNDRLGHAAGDSLLVEVADRLAAGLRSGDSLARYGGDEFVVLCESTEPQQAVTRLGRHIHAALARPFHLAGVDVRVGISVGAVMSDGFTGADELIGRADAAMYQAKQRRRDRSDARVAA
jgi:diguanylate cyclase (GGDEF)-like protein